MGKQDENQTVYDNRDIDAISRDRNRALENDYVCSMLLEILMLVALAVCGAVYCEISNPQAVAESKAK